MLELSLLMELKQTQRFLGGRVAFYNELSHNGGRPFSALLACATEVTHPAGTVCIDVDEGQPGASAHPTPHTHGLRLAHPGGGWLRTPLVIAPPNPSGMGDTNSRAGFRALCGGIS